MQPITKPKTFAANEAAWSRTRPAPLLEPWTIEQWSNFHEHIEGLPDEEREVFNLLWYQGLEQAAAARVVGVDMFEPSNGGGGRPG